MMVTKMNAMMMAAMTAPVAMPGMALSRAVLPLSGEGELAEEGREGVTDPQSHYHLAVLFYLFLGLAESHLS